MMDTTLFTSDPLYSISISSVLTLERASVCADIKRWMLLAWECMTVTKSFKDTLQYMD